MDQSHFSSLFSDQPPVNLEEGPFIDLKKVAKVFKTTAGEYQALKNIDLSFQQGEFTSIMGKSGSGKSTLINMITGIDHPTSGSVRIGQLDIYGMSESQLAQWRGRNLGIVFQFFQLLPTLTVLENTMLPMDFCNRYDPAERELRAMHLLKILGLGQMEDKLPAALSGGQQQIAAIARALANDPPVIVADEPTGNLDSRTAERVLEIFDNLAGRSKTILIVTHDSDLARRSTRRVLISDGELIDEHVAQALPMLPHSQMLHITHTAARRTYNPGATIARQGALEQGFYLIKQGQVEIVRNGTNGVTETVAFLEPGDYFSEMEMIETRFCQLTYRVTEDQAAELLCLSQEQYNHLLETTPGMRDVLHQAALERSSQYCPAKPKRRFAWRRPT